MKYYQQLDITDCGAACLAMIASHFGKELSISEIRSYAGTDVVGTNVKGLIQAAKEYGLSAKAVKGEEKAVTQELPTPFIVHLHIEKEGNWIDHYAVVKRISKNTIELWDPDPLVRKDKISYKQFFSMWTGYALFFQPGIDFKINKEQSNLFVKFLPLLLPHKKLLFYSFLASLLIMIFGIVSSFYFKYLFDEVMYAKMTFSLNSLSIGVLCISIIQNIIVLIRSVLLSHLSFKTDLQMNFSYYSHILKLPISFFESRKTGEILSRLDDLNKIKQTLFYIALSGIMDLLMIIITAPILLKMNSKLFGLTNAFVFLIALVSILFSHVYKSYYPKVMSKNAEVHSFLYETVNGVITIKDLNAVQSISEKYECKKMESVGIDWKLNRYGIANTFIINTLGAVNNIFIFWIGVSSIIADTMSFGMLIAFTSLLSYFTTPLLSIVNMQNAMQEAFVAARRVGEILELDSEYRKSESCIKPSKVYGDIKFDHVSFAYGSRKPIYEDLNLEIKAGEWIGIVGTSGCGKSTLIKLLLKNYQIQKGKILIDNNDISYIDTISLRSQIGYVPQDIFLFSGTIAENISLGKIEVSFEEIVKAARKVGADKFIEKLPKKYETILGEHGAGLSGGEKQRLALARALVGNPSLLILDEATSNLDNVSESEIHDIIKKLRNENMTVIIIAHRLSTVMNCNNIFVMENGNIVQKGTHEELLKMKGLYRKLWDSSK